MINFSLVRLLKLSTKEEKSTFIDADEEMPVPVAPSPQMAMQISTDHPPITDEDYIPTHSTELAKSMYALFEDCPSDQIEYIYRQAHRLRAHAEERSSKF